MMLPLCSLLLCANCTKEDMLSSLPEAAKNYILQNYPDAEVEEAEKEKLCDGTEAIEVELELSEEEEFELIFDLAGNLLFSEKEIAVSTIPNTVKNTIASNYAGFAVKEASRIDMANGSTRYEVELKKGWTTYDVTFDSEGVEICKE